MENIVETVQDETTITTGTGITENSTIPVITPNGINIEAKVIKRLEVCGHPFYTSFMNKRWLCYAQNRLFTVWEKLDFVNNNIVKHTVRYEETLVDYCAIPDLD